MKYITHQKARGICLAEGLDFKTIKTQGPLLLKSGAKLAWSEKLGYKIYGYAHDGSDIVPYNQPWGVLVHSVPRPEDLRYAQITGYTLSIDQHIEDGRVTRLPGNKYVIWCPDGIGRPKAWQAMNIARMATFGVKAEPYTRKAN